MGVFLLSGIASCYLYCLLPDKGGVFLPGVIYTVATLLFFWTAGIRMERRSATMYFFLMNATYLGMWFLTMVSSWFVFIGGIITAGTGAILTFILANKHIVKFSFDKTYVFIFGGLAFLLTDILYWSFDKVPTEYFLKLERSPETLLAEVFIFWQLIVGAMLVLLLRKVNTRKADVGSHRSEMNREE